MNMDKLMPVPVASVKNDGAFKSDDTSKEEISSAEKSLLRKNLKKEEVKEKDIEIQNEGLYSSLDAAKTFGDLQLKPALLRGINALGLNTLSRIQRTALPALLADPPQNVIVQSQYGTGKTIACILALLNRVDRTKKYPQVIYLTSTDVLGIQTGGLAAEISRFCPEIKIKYTETHKYKHRKSNITEHIIIGSVSTVLNWGVNKRFDLGKISVFALVGANLLMESHRRIQCFRFYKFLPRTCQVMYFSACKPEVMSFAKIIMRNPLIVRLRKDEDTPRGRRRNLLNIKQYYVKCNSDNDKYKAVTNIYGLLTIGQAIVFYAEDG